MLENLLFTDKYQEKFFSFTLNFDFDLYRKILIFQEPKKLNDTIIFYMAKNSTNVTKYNTLSLCYHFFNTFLPSCYINIYCQLCKVNVDKYIYYSIYITGRNQK